MNKPKCSDVDKQIKKQEEKLKNDIMKQYSFINDNIYNKLYTFTEKYIDSNNSVYNQQKNKNMNNLLINPSIKKIRIYSIYLILKPQIIEINKIKKNYQNCENNILEGTL